MSCLTMKMKTRTIVLAMVLFLQLRGVVEAANLVKTFPFPLPKEGRGLSLFPSKRCLHCSSPEKTLDTATDISPTNKERDVEDFDNNEFEVVADKRSAKKSEKLVEKKEEDENVIKQVIFIEPPEYVYKHDIKVQSDAKRARTVIYVFPPRVKHIYNITDKRTLSELMEEPKVFYLGATKHDGNGVDEEVEEIKKGKEGEKLMEDNYQDGNFKSEKFVKFEAGEKSFENFIDEVKVSPLKPKLFEAPSYVHNEIQQSATTEEPKYYRRFNYFSPKDYEEIMTLRRRQKEDEEAQAQNFVQYLQTEMSAITEVPAPDLSKLGPLENFSKLKYPGKSAPVVNLQYEDSSYIPVKNLHSDESTPATQFLSPPPVPSSLNEEWKWGNENEKQFTQSQDSGYRTIIMDNQKENVSSNVKEDLQDNIASGSEWSSNYRNYDFFPALFRNYLYHGPNL